MVGKSCLQEIAILAIIREISDSNLETGDTVQNLESPGLSGRVGSTEMLLFQSERCDYARVEPRAGGTNRKGCLAFLGEAKGGDSFAL